MSKEFTWAVAADDWDLRLINILKDLEKGNQRNIERHKAWIKENIPKYEILLETLIVAVLSDRKVHNRYDEGWPVTLRDKDPNSRINRVKTHSSGTEIMNRGFADLLENRAHDVDYAICCMWWTLWFFVIPQQVEVLNDLVSKKHELTEQFKKMKDGVYADGQISLNEAKNGAIWIQKKKQQLDVLREEVMIAISVYQKAWSIHHDFSGRRLKYERSIPKSLSSENRDLGPKYQNLAVDINRLIEDAAKWQSQFESVLNGHS